MTPAPAASAAPDLSPVATLCLAILQHGEATGYEIKKASVEGDFSCFLEASFGAIYPALARLETARLVTLRAEAAAGRPTRKVYAITPAGRAALFAALSQAPGADHFRSPFLLVARFAADLPRPVVEAAVAERRRWLRGELARVEAIAAGDLDEASRWIVDYGRHCIATSLAYLDANAASLVAAAEAPALAAE